MQEATIGRVEDLLKQFAIKDNYRANNPLLLGGKVWWRGQSSDKPLIPKAFRPTFDGDEAYHFKHFTARAPARYANCPDRGDLAGWMFLMQHYGFPTRLLDWSASFAVALWFATENSRSVDGAAESFEGGILWAIRHDILNNAMCGDNQIKLAPAPGDCSDPYSVLFSDVLSNTKDKHKVFALLPTETDTRMVVQQAGFTIHGSNKALESFDDASAFSATSSTRAPACTVSKGI